MDIHRTFAEVVFWGDGRLRWHGRIDMTRSALEGFGHSLTKGIAILGQITNSASNVDESRTAGTMVGPAR